MTIEEAVEKCKPNSTYIGFCFLSLTVWVCCVAFSYRRIVGQNIRTHRKQAGLSQESLAEKASLSYKYVGEVERGTVNVSLDSLMRIVKVLKIKLGDLVLDL